MFPRYLPQGFQLEAMYLGRGGMFPKGEKPKLLKSVYTDGFVRIELYQRRSLGEQEDGVVRESTRGSRTKMRLALGELRISLEGRLDPKELREVVKSLGQ